MTDEERLEAAWVGDPPKLSGKIELAPYDARWVDVFDREAVRIRSVLGDSIILIEHVGSTSVALLAAKPVIDILLVLATPADEPTYVPALEAAGYRLVIREPDWYEHRVFKGPDTNINLHVHPPDSPEIARMIDFRDHLRTRQGDRLLYESEKRRLAARDWDYVQHYADAKTEVVEAIIARAQAKG